MKKTFEAFLPYLIPMAERALSISAFIFPFIEVASYFGPKVFLSTESATLRSFYLNHLVKLSSFYTDNNLLIFILTPSNQFFNSFTSTCTNTPCLTNAVNKLTL